MMPLVDFKARVSMVRLWYYTCSINILEKKCTTVPVKVCWEKSNSVSGGHCIIFTLSHLFQTQFLEPFRPCSHVTNESILILRVCVTINTMLRQRQTLRVNRPLLLPDTVLFLCVICIFLGGAAWNLNIFSCKFTCLR